MRLILTLLAAASLAACASTQSFHVSQPQSTFQSAGGVAEAGAVSVDITPPPGMPMGGYSVMANKGEGFRTRIKARVIYLSDGKGHAMAIVQGDLTAASLLAHHMIAAKVAESTGLKPSDIAFTASHTHSSPVNFFDNDFYNKHTSSGQWLEVSYLNLMVNQISDGIIAAYEIRRPAKIATGKKDIYGLNRNRAMTAYVLNKDVKGLSLDDPEAKYKAVNPSLYMVRVDAQDQDGKYKPLAAFSSFSMHNTTIAAPVDIYNGDVFGFAQRDLEWAMTDKYQPSWQVVSALTNGTHGDMAPNVHDEGDNWVSHYPVEWKVSSELGHKLGSASIELFNELEPALTSKVTLASAARELNIREHNKVDGIELCKDAAVGAPVAAGAYERRTPWLTLMPFFHGGNFMTRRTFFKDGCQGTKQHLGFAYLQPLLEPKDSFPNTVMFQILRINDMVVLPLPFEVTVESGRRIAKAVDEVFAKAGNAPKYTWVASVSNGYFGYTTTPEEYAYQNYEGGHTLYGKNNTPYLTAQLQHLAQDYLSEGSVAEMKPNWDYLLTVNNFYPETQEAKGQRALLKQPETVLASKDRDEDYVRVQWLDVNASQINLHQALVQVEKREGQAWVPLIVNGNRINDEGYDIEVRYLDEAKDGMAEYETRWYNPAAGGEYRFVIAARANQPALYSAAFRVDTKAQVALLND